MASCLQHFRCGLSVSLSFLLFIPLFSPGYHERPIYGLSWCPQTALLATACGDNFVRVFREVKCAEKESKKHPFPLIS